MPKRVSFYFDEHMSNAVAEGLRGRGVDVLTTHEANRRGFSDEEQLAFAFQHGRVMVTMDSDYIALSAQGISHAGIAYAKFQSLSVGQWIQGLQLIFEVLDADDMKNHVEYL